MSLPHHTLSLSPGQDGDPGARSFCPPKQAEGMTAMRDAHPSLRPFPRALGQFIASLL